MARLFELENDQIEKQNQVRGIITSVAIHSLLLVLFYFLLAMQPPNPPLDGGGVEINFGYMDDGMGDIQPEGNSATPVLPQASKPVVEKKPSGDKIISQDNSDVVIGVKKKDDDIKKTTNKTETKPTPTTEEKKQVAKAIWHGPGPNSNNSKSEGDGTNPGDKGKPNGSLTGTNYDGTPGKGGGMNGYDGSGPKYDLKGRTMLKKPVLKNLSQETGIIIIKIKVNKQGKVISADGPAQGSTTTSAYLLGLAKTASLTTVQFDTNTAEEQFGTITYNFTAK